MAFFTPSWMVFWKTHGVKTMPTGRATPWPNRAETAVRLFKRQYEKLLMEASTHPTLSKVTLRDLIRECCWARNTTLTISGYTPVELATGPFGPTLARLVAMPLPTGYGIQAPNPNCAWNWSVCTWASCLFVFLPGCFFKGPPPLGWISFSRS